jgi:hypothetical protein
MAHPRYRRPLLVVIPLLVAVVGVVIGVTVALHRGASPSVDSTGLPLSPVSAGQVAARPEAHLNYPGSTVLVHQESSEKAVAGDTPDPAAIRTILVSDASEAQIRGWYSSQLLAQNWQCYLTAIASYMSVMDAYRRGARESFFVGIVKPTLLYPHFGVKPPSSGTIYEVDYLIAPQGVTLGVGPSNSPC